MLALVLMLPAEQNRQWYHLNTVSLPKMERILEEKSRKRVAGCSSVCVCVRVRELNANELSVVWLAGRPSVFFHLPVSWLAASQQTDASH